MGFGILLFGYLFLTDVQVAVNTEFAIGFDVLPDIIGFIIMFKALTMLSASYAPFAAPRKVIYPLFATSAVSLVCQLISIFKIAPSVISKILEILTYTDCVLLIIFHIALFKVAKDLTKEIDLEDISKVMGRAMILSAVFYSLHLVLMILAPFSQNMGSFIPFFNLTYYISLLFQYFVLFYNILAIYKCYMFIGYEGEDTSLDVKHPLQILLDKLKK